MGMLKRLSISKGTAGKESLQPQKLNLRNSKVVQNPIIIYVITVHLIPDLIIIIILSKRIREIRR
jgi:hypothetical protein